MEIDQQSEFLQHLPAELIFQLFETLPIKDVLNIRQLCRRLWVLGRDEKFWKLQCSKQLFGTHNLLASQYGHTWEWLFRSKVVDIVKLELKLKENPPSAMQIDSDIASHPLATELVGFRTDVDNHLDKVITQQGCWVDGTLEGYGMLIRDAASEELAMFEGLFSAGEFLRGRVWFESGGSYFGDCTGLRRQGRGKYNYKNGSVYEGEWYESFRHGQGTMTYHRVTVSAENAPNRTNIEGSRELDLPSVVASQNAPEAYTKYEGAWMCGVFHGKGKMKYVSGEVYEGEWFRGRRHGEGTLYGADGRLLYSGKWERGKLPEARGSASRAPSTGAEALLLHLALLGGRPMQK